MDLIVQTTDIYETVEVAEMTTRHENGHKSNRKEPN